MVTSLAVVLQLRLHLPPLLQQQQMLVWTMWGGPL